MTTGAFMDALAQRGVVFWLDGPQLRVKAPVGVLTDEDRAQLRLQRDAIRRLVAYCLPPEAFACLDTLPAPAQLPLGAVA